MKIFDLLSLALKTLKSKWTILPMIGIAVSTFCLCFAGATWTSVEQEKSLPYELVATTEGTVTITSSTVAEISKIPDVKDVTAFLQIPVSIKSGKYQTQITLNGIEASYLQEPFSSGDIFVDNSVMPYIVLNEAVCKRFVFENTPANHDPITVDWLNANFSLEMDDESKAITAKVCGILATVKDPNDSEPKAYVSLSVAKEILRKSGQSTDSTTVHIRITNSGKAENVSKAIIALGMTVSNSNEELQTKWDSLQKEMRYLIVMSVFALICATALLAAWRRIFSFEEKEALEVLDWLGMSKKAVNGIFMMQTLIISLWGSVIGPVVSLSLPPFLPIELMENSAFLQPIPFRVAVISIVICIVSALLPMAKRIPKEKWRLK